MKCEDINELLAAYLDEEVTPEERGQIEAHLSSCEKCQVELRLLATTREGLRQVLKTRAGGVEPSPQVWDVVSQRITAKSSFWEQLGGILNRPVWRAVIPVALVVVLVVGVLWGTGILSQFGGGMAPPPAPAPAPTIPAPTVPPPVITIPPPAPITPVPTPTPAPTPASVPTPTPGPTPLPSLRISGATAKTSYLPGETIEVNMSFTNETAGLFTLVTFPPQVDVIKSAPYEVFRSFPAGTETKSLNSQEVITYKLTWDQKNNAGQQVAPGWYYIQVKLTTISGTPSHTITSTRTLAKVLIQYPQGAMEKNIEVNHSLTVNGITITLERVELTATGMKVYAFNLPPDYNLPQGPMLPPPQLMSIHAEAEYSIDGGTVKQAGMSGIRFLDNGMRHSWDNLDPVPSDAKTLTFRIPLLGDPRVPAHMAGVGLWQGPWEFKIPLE